MKQLHFFLCTATTYLVVRPLVAFEIESSLVQTCSVEGGDEEVCSHTSLLQTSVTMATKGEATKVEPPSKLDSELTRHSPSGHQRESPTPIHQRPKAVHYLASASLLASEHGSRRDAQNHTMYFLSCAILVVVIVVLFMALRRQTPQVPRFFEGQATLPADVELRRPCSFDDDVYSCAISLIVRDLQACSKGVGFALPRFRICYATTLLFVTLGIQIMLLAGTKAFVTPQAVANIRESYDAYEIHMYGGKDNTRVLYTGKHRGNPGFFQPELFKTFPDNKKSDVCQIPFSQLKFLVLILLIWSITCVAQIKRCIVLGWNLLVALPTISSMSDSMVHEAFGKPRRKRTIVGLTLGVKFAMLFTIFLPWIACTCYLCWLGCRWLAATNKFGDFLANGMALEFILQLKTLLYYAICTERTKRDVDSTRHMPPTKYEDVSFSVYFSSVGWGLVACGWVYLYIFYLQHVLPEYQWDVHGPCTPFLMGQLTPKLG